MTRNNLPEILAKRNIQAIDFARTIKKSRSFVSRLLAGKLRPSQDTIDDILDTLGLTYEECFKRRRRRRLARTPGRRASDRLPEAATQGSTK